MRYLIKSTPIYVPVPDVGKQKHLFQFISWKALHEFLGDENLFTGFD